MKNLFALLSVAALLNAGLALADAPKTGAKKTTKPAATKVVDVKTCPMTGEAVKDIKVGDSEVVGNYKLHFCCAGCKPEFDKLSAKDKKAKLDLAIKKDAAAAKSKKS